MVTHKEILQAISDRGTWERRQATWYQMRHDGLRRKNKPWPNAADMHFPLGDMQIEKHKPAYVQQIFAGDTIATFAGLSTELTPYNAAAAQYLDYQLKQRSNFEPEMIIAADIMLQSGKAVVHPWWDLQAGELRFEAIEPTNLIVPTQTKRLEDADWIVRVKQYSPAAYSREANYRQDEAFVASITGRGADNKTLETAIAEREGITHGSTDQIVVWEVYERLTTGWIVRTYSPQNNKEPVRPTFGLPYNQGIFARGLPPFCEFNCEMKSSGFYGSRGIVERVAPFEASLNKDWNTQKDYQSLTCQPMFAAPNGLGQNQGNVRMVPGQILPFALTAVQFPSMPMDIGMQMQQTRMVAEQAVATPDFGAVQAAGQKPRTATEMNLVGSVMGQSTDLRARIFRRELGRLLQMSWALVLQYGKTSLDYFYMDELAQLPEQALTARYIIEPSGSGDNMNRQLVLQKAIARKQMFQGNPNIDQGELDKSVLEADDPRLVRRLFRNAGTQAAEQLEDQAQEITIIMEGFPAQVRPTDDDAAHVQCVMQFIQRRNNLRQPLNPEQMQMLAQHMEQHVQALKKKNPAQFAQVAPQVMPLIKQLSQLAAQVHQAQAAQQSQPPVGPQGPAIAA